MCGQCVAYTAYLHRRLRRELVAVTHAETVLVQRRLPRIGGLRRIGGASQTELLGGRGAIEERNAGLRGVAIEGVGAGWLGGGRRLALAGGVTAASGLVCAGDLHGLEVAHDGISLFTLF